MIDFLWETLLLLPFLLVTYLVLEAVEAHAGGALERFLGRTPFWGPLAGALVGAVPQCGVSAAAASSAAIMSFRISRAFSSPLFAASEARASSLRPFL